MQNLVTRLVAIWRLLANSLVMSSSPSGIRRGCTSRRHRSGFELIVDNHIMNIIVFLDCIMLVIALGRGTI